MIVGGANGMGKAIALALAEEGARIALVDRDSNVASEAARITDRYGVPAIGLACDVTDGPAVQRAAARVIEEFGRCDHVVYAAAITSGKFGFPFWNLEPADWPRVLEVNLVGAVHVVHAFVPFLVQARSGSVLLISSVAGQIGSQTDPPYSASKAGLINFGQCAAKDLAPYGVRVNCLCPGMVRTTLNRSVWEASQANRPEAERVSYDDWTQAKIRAVVPLGRWQEPEDIAAMAAFLCSPRAQNVTGQTVNVDGGYVMHW